ncbi:MAG: PTS fructose transporter subunit IIA [Pseudomonadota bacterium]
MIGVLLVTHGPLGENLIDAAVHVLGSRPRQLEALDVSSRAEPRDVETMITLRMQALDTGDGVLVLTDIYGATPSNCMCRALAPGHAAGVSGVNLPMLLKMLNYRDLPLDQLAAKAALGGQEGISIISRDMCDAAAGH